MKKEANERVRELVAYLIFGVLTTAVGMLTYFGILAFGESILKIDPGEASFYYVRLAAEIIHWIVAVLFAFFTNRKWVFTDADQSVSTMKQLTVFAGGRLVTLGLDAIITFGTVWVLLSSHYVPLTVNIIISLTITADLISKLVASVVVIVANYVISKLFVFKKAK